MNRLIYILILIFLVSCQKDEDGYELYIVKAHHETCRPIDRLFAPNISKNSLDFSYKVNHTWVWTDEGVNHSYPGTAKITGLSDGFHRNDSYRLGYRHDYGVGEVGLFVEQGESYHFVPLEVVVPGGTYHCRLSVEDGHYVARQGGNVARYPIRKDKDWGYRCYPCMAGGYDLNHDWEVWIKYD